MISLQNSPRTWSRNPREFYLGECLRLGKISKNSKFGLGMYFLIELLFKNTLTDLLCMRIFH